MTESQAGLSSRILPSHSGLLLPGLGTWRPLMILTRLFSKIWFELVRVTGKLSLWLKALLPLSEDWNSVCNTHARWCPSACDFGSKGSDVLLFLLVYIFLTSSSSFDTRRHFQHSLTLNSQSCNLERSRRIVWDCSLDSLWGSLSPSSCHTSSYRRPGRGHVAEWCRLGAAGAWSWCTGSSDCISGFRWIPLVLCLQVWL